MLALLFAGLWTKIAGWLSNAVAPLVAFCVALGLILVVLGVVFEAGESRVETKDAAIHAAAEVRGQKAVAETEKDAAADAVAESADATAVRDFERWNRVSVAMPPVAATQQKDTPNAPQIVYRTVRVPSPCALSGGDVRRLRPVGRRAGRVGS
jgi:hypothetical protein